MLLKLVPEGTTVPFVNARKLAYVLSALMILGSIGIYFSKGLIFGIVLKGGFLI